MKNNRIEMLLIILIIVVIIATLLIYFKLESIHTTPSLVRVVT
ncbi:MULTISPECIES: hypothetical protein [unclassified Gemella]|nr:MULTISPECIES: hypothetical protein [unclassified Gemella]